MTTHILAGQVAPAVHVTTQKVAVLTGAVMVQLVLRMVYGYSVFWQPLEASLWPPILTADQASALASGDEQPAAGSLIVASRGRRNTIGSTGSVRSVRRAVRTWDI